ncbi:GIY-YIG nuclease family protein [Prosthecochloris sp. CIB 2401]|uniref:GIY-YIG nuclease family protein n=1 Tax=Prosthecochloris sp. CIB 2401 TaxID=1868325 RepID=UPI00080A99DF|nr:GIY-YIG nuclease family protein [Prosthecochloris sp. CIB 2401]ANT64100.1 hypothetical protein Ptc2401_00299 [Prosthecochloris sp. CIB 2401]
MIDYYGYPASREGTYILVIRLSRPISLSFGRFLDGREVLLPMGTWFYIGSALGASPGSSPLARRLLRHASRGEGRKPHAIRGAMVRSFRQHGLMERDTTPPAEKKLRWHIDYLLQRKHATINDVLLVRSPERLESEIARFTASLEGVEAPVPSLGARDTRGETHLLLAEQPDSALAAMREFVSKRSEVGSGLFRPCL